MVFLKIGYISPVNPFNNRNGWSGTYYNTCQALINAGHDVDWVTYQTESTKQKILRICFKLLYFRKGNPIYWEKIGKIRANSINKDLDKYDLIFIPAQSEVLAWIKTNTPIVYYSDSTIPLMENYYWFNTSRRFIKLSERTEKRALNNATLKLYASHWAANSAIDFYKQDRKTVKVFPFGANIPNEVMKPSYRFNKDKVINILFSGVDWERKGGNIAVKAVEKLIDDGYKVKLYICGIRNLSKNITNYSFVVNKGFLNKNNPDELKEYVSLWRKADLFILPTRAECAGIVFSEASGFGVPIITTDTGGISDYVVNGINGYRMQPTDGSNSYALKIEQIISHDELDKLSHGALKLYMRSTSWKAWGKSFNDAIKKFL